MKTRIIALYLSALCALLVSGCVTSSNPGAVTSTQQTVADIAETTVSIGLVPVFVKNPSYIPAAQTVAAALASVTGDSITPEGVDAFLAKVPQLSPADRQTIAGVVNAAWTAYAKRYQTQVNANTRPDVKLFLTAIANGVVTAAASVPKAS